VLTRPYSDVTVLQVIQGSGGGVVSATERRGLALDPRGSASAVDVHADDVGVGEPDGWMTDLGAGMPPA